MVTFFSKSERLHQLLMIPSVIEQKEIDKTLIAFRKLLAEINESELEAVTSRDSYGETVLHLIAKDSRLNSLINELLQRYPQLISIPNNRGIYPIHMAILNHNKELLDTLLSSSATLRDYRRQTIIHYAVDAWPEVLVPCCNAAISLLNERDEEGRTALDKAKTFKDETAQHILQNLENSVRYHGARS